MPVAITVQHGNHGWVLTGFTATADPAMTTHFTVTSVRVVGPLWGLQNRSYGYDMRPDTKLTPSQFKSFFTPWHYGRIRMAWEGDWVSIQADPDVESGRSGGSRDDGRECHAEADGQADTGTDAHANADADRRPRLPSDTPEPTPAAIAAVAGPISSRAAARRSRVGGPAQIETGWDPWAFVALAAAVLLVLGGRGPRSARVGAPASERRREPELAGTAPRQRS